MKQCGGVEEVTVGPHKGLRWKSLFWFSGFSKHRGFTHGPSNSQLITQNVSYPFLDTTMWPLIFVHQVWWTTTNIQDESGTKCTTIYEDNGFRSKKSWITPALKFVHGEQTLRVINVTLYEIFTQLPFLFKSTKSNFAEDFATCEW